MMIILRTIWMQIKILSFTMHAVGGIVKFKYLLEKQSPHVTERNVDGKLPFHLLCESGASSNSF